MISISLCMIVKNEEKLLKRCLDSYRPVCDEIVTVDTGSTDRTKEIAAGYTDLIYDYPWTTICRRKKFCLFKSKLRLHFFCRCGRGLRRGKPPPVFKFKTSACSGN